MITIYDNYYEVQPNDDVIKCARRGNDTIINLMCLSDYTEGQEIVVVKTSSTANQVHITCAESKKIDGMDELIIQSLNGSYRIMVTNECFNVIGVDDYDPNDIDILKDVTEGAIPYKQGKVLIDSGFSVTPALITSFKDIELPPNTLHLGTNVAISENGGFVEYHTNTLDKRYVFLDYENDHRSGSSAPIYWKRSPLIENVVIQPDDTYKMVDVTTFSVNSTNNSEISKLYFNIAKNDDEKGTLPNNVRIRMIVNGNPVAHYPSKQAWDFPMLDEGRAFNEGINTFELVPHFSFLNAYGSITFEIRNDGPIPDYVPVNLMGSKDLNLPYMACDKNEITAVEMDMDSPQKRYGKDVRIIGKDTNIIVQQRVEHEGEPDTWDDISAITPRGNVMRSLRLTDMLATDNPLRTTIYVDRRPLTDAEGNILNPEMDLPVFEIRALGGAFSPCITLKNSPVSITDEGNIVQLATMEDVKTTWDPKVIKYNEKDNIIIDTVKRIKMESDQILFHNRKEELKETVLGYELPEGFHGTYDIKVSQAKRNVSAELRDITLITPTTRHNLLMGLNENIEIDENTFEIAIEAVGQQWTDIAMPWRDGVLEHIQFEFINKTSGNEIPMLVDEGVINPVLMPKIMPIGKLFRFRQDGISLKLERLVGEEWTQVTEFN